MAFLEKAVDFCACDAHVSRIIVPISINFKEDWKLSDYYVFLEILMSSLTVLIFIYCRCSKF